MSDLVDEYLKVKEEQRSIRDMESGLYSRARTIIEKMGKGLKGGEKGVVIRGDKAVILSREHSGTISVDVEDILVL